MILNYFSKSYDLIAQKINIKASHNYRFSCAYIGFMLLPQPNHIILGEKKTVYRLWPQSGRIKP